MHMQTSEIIPLASLDLQTYEFSIEMHLHITPVNLINVWNVLTLKIKEKYTHKMG